MVEVQVEGLKVQRISFQLHVRKKIHAYVYCFCYEKQVKMIIIFLSSGKDFKSVIRILDLLAVLGMEELRVTIP